MNKTQLVDAIVAKTGMKKKDAEAALSAAVESITEALANGEKPTNPRKAKQPRPMSPQMKDFSKKLKILLKN